MPTEVPPSEREAALDALAARLRGTQRQSRRPLGRAVWIAGILVGMVGLVAFLYALLVTPDPPPTVGARPAVTLQPARSMSFTAGVAIGVVIGLVLGIVIGRQRPSHSSRNRP